MREENEKMKHWAFRSQEPRKERGEGTAKMRVKGSQEEQLCPEPRSSWSRMEKRMRGLPGDTPAFQILPQQENNTRNAGLDEAQGGIKIARRNINNLRYADDTTFMAESEEELKTLLMKVNEESEKAGLKLKIQKN